MEIKNDSNVDSNTLLKPQENTVTSKMDPAAMNEAEAREELHDFNYESMSQSEKIDLMISCGMYHSHKRVAAYFKHFLMKAEGKDVINLALTVRLLDRAVREIKEIFASGGSALFVSTKQQVSSIVEREARRAKQHWVTKKWIGGMLTNMKYTVRKTLDTLTWLDNASQNHDLYTKKERNSFIRKHQSRFTYLEGVSGGTEGESLDKSNIKLVVVVDPAKEFTAVQEVLNLRDYTTLRDCATKRPPALIVIGDGFGNKFNTDILGRQDIFIPANDDGSTSVEFLTVVLAHAISSSLQDSAQRIDTGTLKDEMIKKLDGYREQPTNAANR